MTDPRPPIWPSYRARAVIAALLLILALYGIFGVEPLTTGELTNIPEAKIDRFDPIAELPWLQSMVGPDAIYKGLNVSGLRADGTLKLRERASARYTFLVPRPDGGHDEAVLFVWPPGWSQGGWFMLAGLRWERGISTRRFGFTGEPAVQAAPSCDLAAMIADAMRTERIPDPLGDIELDQADGIYTLTFKGTPAADAEPIHDKIPAARGPSYRISYHLVLARTVEYGADCARR